jgi:hypothetical protein
MGRDLRQIEGDYNRVQMFISSVGSYIDLRGCILLRAIYNSCRNVLMLPVQQISSVDSPLIYRFIFCQDNADSD